MGAIALFSTTNTVLILLVSTSRLLYGVSKAEYRSFPTVFSRIHPTQKTPHYAVLLTGAAAIPFTLLGDIGRVAGMANLLLLVVFLLVNAALLRLRFVRPGTDGFRVPLNVGRVPLTAVAGLLTSLGLIVVYFQRIV